MKNFLKVFTLTILFVFSIQIFNCTDAAETTPAAMVSSLQVSTEDFPPNYWPPEPPECITGSQQFATFLTASWNSCAGRMNDRLRKDYPVIVAHVMAGVIFPAVWPAVMKEVYAELGKDGMYCTLTAIVEAAGGTQEAKNDAKQAINSMLEIYDTAGDVAGMKDPVQHLHKYGRENIMKDPERANAIVFFLKNVKEGVVDLPQEHVPTMVDLIDKYMTSTERKTQRAISDAQDKIRECEFDAAKNILNQEMMQGLHWLSQYRAAIVQQRKDISCSAQALDKYKREHPPLAGFPDPMLRNFENEHAALESKLPKLVSEEQNQVKYLRELKEEFKVVEGKARELERVQLHTDKRLKSATDGLAACDFAKVESELKSLAIELQGWCGIAMGKQFESRNAILEQLNERKASAVADEKFISDGLQFATDLLASNAPCADIESKLQSVEKRLNNSTCVNRTQAVQRISALRAAINSSTSAAKLASDAFAAGRAALQNCDAPLAEQSVALARAELGKVQCTTPGGGTPTMADIQVMDTSAKQMQNKIKELVAEATQKLSNARFYAENCDLVRLQAALTEMDSLVQNFGTCPVPAEIAGISSEMQKLIQQATEGLKTGQKEAQKTIQEGKDALQRCDPLGANAAADELEFLGKVCGMDTTAEGQKLRSAGDEIVKMITALDQNTAAIRQTAQGALNTCDLDKVKWAQGEMNRVVDLFAQKCSQVPESVTKNVQEVQKFLKSAEEMVASEKDARKLIQEGKDALQKCDALGAVAAADELEFLGKVCGMDTTAEGQNLRTAADTVAKMIGALEQNAAATRQLAQNAWQACDAAKVKSAASEMTRLIDGFSQKCSHYPPGVTKDFDEVQKILQSANDLAAAETAIRDAFQKGQTALGKCEPKNAKNYFDDAVTIYNNKVNNRQCQIYSVVQNATQGGQTAENLLDLGNSLITVVEDAGFLMEECSEDLTAIYDKLKHADGDIAQFQNTGINCDVREPQQEVSAMRKELKEIEDTRNQLRKHVLLAQGAINAKGVDRSRAIEQARKGFEQIETLMKNKRQECYDELNSQIENLRAGLGLSSQGELANIPDEVEEDFGIDENDLGDEEEEPGEEEDFGDGEEEDSDISDLGVEDIPEDAMPDDSNVAVSEDEPPPPQVTAGAHWILESTTVSPEKPDPGWSFGGPQAASAQLTIYNGDTAIFQWTPPPQQIGSDGFTVALSAQGLPADPRGRVAALIGVSASECDANLPSDQWTAYAVAPSGAGPSSASRSVTFKPQPTASELEVRIGIMWGGLNFVYKYRRAS